MPIVLRGTTALDDLIIAVCMVIVVIVLLLPWISTDVAQAVKKFLKIPPESNLPIWSLVLAFFLILICFYFILHGI